MRLILLWLALAPALPAQVYEWFSPGSNFQAQPVQSGPKVRHTATGTVVNSVTGEPIRRALVRINGAGEQHSGFTGGDGRFSIDGVAEGLIVISAEKPGFFDEHSISGAFSQSNFINFGA